MTPSEFSASPTGRIVKAMLNSGNKPGLIQGFYSLMGQWADSHNNADADAIKSWLPRFRPRPFYTARELAPLFPALACVMGYRKAIAPQMGSERLSHLLRVGGLPVLFNDFGRDRFAHPAYPVRSGYHDHFFIVEQCHYWKQAGISQLAFNDLFPDKDPDCRKSSIGDPSRAL